MKVRLPQPEVVWNIEFQRRLHAELERAFDRLGETTGVPAGGTAGQVLTKVSAYDWDLTWAAGGGGGGYPPQLGYAGI